MEEGPPPIFLGDSCLPISSLILTMVYGGEDEIGRGKSLTPNRDIENNAPQMADSLRGKTQQLGRPFTMMTIVMRILLVLLMMTISMVSMGLAVAMVEHFFIVGLRE